MTSRFVDSHLKNDIDEQFAFQAKVLRMLAEIFPDREFTANIDPLLIDFGGDGQHLGLTNIRANYLLGERSDKELRELLELHISTVLDGFDESDFENVDFDDVSGQLLPQIMPEDFQRHIDISSYQLGNGLVLSFVIDGEDAYKYVSVSDVKKWGIEIDKLREIAVGNLVDRSQNIEMSVFGDDNKLFVINTMDGFDAARIVLPEMRTVIGDHIGLPFHVGIPNRDFLICWSDNGDQEFHSQMVSQISSDFDERPYPLSREPFFVDKNTLLVFRTPENLDPRAASADLN